MGVIPESRAAYPGPRNASSRDARTEGLRRRHHVQRLAWRDVHRRDLEPAQSRGPASRGSARGRHQEGQGRCRRGRISRCAAFRDDASFCLFDVVANAACSRPCLSGLLLRLYRRPPTGERSLLADDQRVGVASIAASRTIVAESAAPPPAAPPPRPGRRKLMANYEHVLIARQDISPQQAETLNEEMKALIRVPGRSHRQDRILGSAQPVLPDQEEPQGPLFPPRHRRPLGGGEGDGSGGT